MQARAIFQAAQAGVEEGSEGEARGDDSARRSRRGAEAARRPSCSRRRRQSSASPTGRGRGLPGRDHDRGAARGALTADEIAKEAQFFSFGTNDLTQMGFGLSRDDAGKFLGYYQEHGILERDPFVSIDVEGIGALVEIGVKKGRSTKPDLKIGICGEHGGDPSSIRFCHEVGLNYVSCSPYRVPIARLAAAQAQLEKPVGD